MKIFEIMHETFNERTVKIEKNSDSFYNPAQLLNRDLTIEVVRHYFEGRESIRVLDAMSATGLRGLRYAKEIPTTKVFLNDISTSAIETIKNNIVLNGYEDYHVMQPGDDIRAQHHKINVTQGDCIDIMNKYRGAFDVVDIDPFGSCANFVNEAFRAVKHNGLICFTCTDKASLCANERKCYMRYGSHIKRIYAKNEIAVRVLLSYISRELAKYDASIVPLVSLSVDFYVRVIVQVRKGNGKSVVENNGHVLICNCLNQKSAPFNTVVDNTCEVCSGRMKLYGPFWNKAVCNKELIAKIINNTQVEGNERMIGILKLMHQEIDDIFYYELSQLCSKTKTSGCKLREMMNALTNAGFTASLVHYDNNSIKSNAPLPIINDILLDKASETPSKYNYARNEYVDAIFSEMYYKGKVMSGMGPLALPRKDTDADAQGN